MFFSLTLGFGVITSFASYNPRKNNCIRDAYILVLVNCGTSVFAGMVVFSILDHRGFILEKDIDEVSAMCVGLEIQYTLKFVNYFCKKHHPRGLTGFWIHHCILLSHSRSFNLVSKYRFLEPGNYFFSRWSILDHIRYTKTYSYLNIFKSFQFYVHLSFESIDS